MALNNKSFLVTGGAGFIGSNIVEYLLKNNCKFVRIIDNLITGKMENINEFLESYTNIEFIEGDITDFNTCTDAVKNIDVIIHQAALGSVPRSVNDPITSHNTNATGTLNMMVAAQKSGIKRFVYASSSSVYGDDMNLPKTEQNTGNPLSPYAVTKCISELYAKVFTNLHDMECIGLRYFNVFGPKQDPDGAYAAVIPKFIKLLMNNTAPTINGNGEYSRDFTYIDNVVSANIKAATINNSNKELFGQVYNIGAGGRITINELYFAITTYMKKDIIPIYGTVRLGDIPHSNASIDKAKTNLDYAPNINFTEGIKKTIDYFYDKF